MELVSQLRIDAVIVFVIPGRPALFWGFWADFSVRHLAINSNQLSFRSNTTILNNAFISWTHDTDHAICE